MKDEFDLFATSDESGAPADADIALITAFLARELTVVQIVAVEERLATDSAFREKVQPIVEAWVLPLPQIGRPSIKVLQPSASTVASSVAHARTVRHTGKQSTKRIAAGIALILAPAALLSQIVIYVANTPGTPGHRTARTIVPSWLQNAEPSAIDLTKQESDNAASFNDGPLQITLEGATQQVQVAAPLLELSAPRAVTTRILGAVFGIKETNDGGLLVNDSKYKQMHLFAADLKTSILALDSAGGTSRKYGGGLSTMATALIPFLGDSALFPDRESGVRSLLVLNGRGDVVRSMAVDLVPMLGYRGPTHADARGHMVFRANASQTPVEVPEALRLSPRMPGAGRAAVAAGAGGAGGGRGGSASGGPRTVTAFVDQVNDSLPLLRLDVDARRIDTLDFVAQPVAWRNPSFPGGSSTMGSRIVVYYDNAGKAISVKQRINPVQTGDEWAVLSDGTIAIVRGSDYHVDWIHPDGSRSASAKIPFDWQRIDDNAKQRMVDSIRTALDSLEAWARRRVAGTPAPGDSIAAMDSISAAGGLANCGIGGLDGRVNCPPAPRTWPFEFAPLSEIADYQPAFSKGAAIADRDGNLWVLPRTTTLSKQGELIYDVLNPTRGLLQRVRLPLGRSIAGFGKGGIVYLQFGDLKKGFVIEKVQLLK